jgi:hypothetical protein
MKSLLTGLVALLLLSPSVGAQITYAEVSDCMHKAVQKALTAAHLDEPPAPTDLRITLWLSLDTPYYLVNIRSDGDTVSGKVIGLTPLFGWGDHTKNRATEENGVFCAPFGIYFAFEAKKLEVDQINWDQLYRTLVSHSVFELPAGAYEPDDTFSDGYSISVESHRGDKAWTAVFNQPDMQETTYGSKAHEISKIILRYLTAAGVTDPKLADRYGLSE